MELLALSLIVTLMFIAGLALQRPWQRRLPAWPQRAPFLGGGNKVTKKKINSNTKMTTKKKKITKQF